MKTVICAYDLREAREVRYEAGLQPHEAVFVCSTRDLRGLGEFKVITTPRFYQRRDAREINEMIAFILASHAQQPKG
ncbi:hypothetical protein ABZ470_39370 [Streptosporangium sp. NPDC020072]|uniref:hypothetical protein n=1 Tax=Streptosporangium sp. NPDC020072 TaxID=3154788 RepID=UPI00341CE138